MADDYAVTIDDLVRNLRQIREQHGNIPVVVLKQHIDAAEHNPLLSVRGGLQRDFRVTLFPGRIAGMA